MMLLKWFKYYSDRKEAPNSSQVVLECYCIVSGELIME